MKWDKPEASAVPNRFGPVPQQKHISVHAGGCLQSIVTAILEFYVRLKDNSVFESVLHHLQESWKVGKMFFILLFHSGMTNHNTSAFICLDDTMKALDVCTVLTPLMDKRCCYKPNTFTFS